MSKINILSSKIYNRIAAGEVVERPSSVVKELVENSIDAGATSVIIETERGGIASVRITDNGSGIEKSELTKAVMPHATSKISTLNDLDGIVSLGFRGEALASIASVSKLTIISKPKGQEVGARLYTEGGESIEISDYASATGTEITVNNLFFNTPAREKFLKTDKSEEGEITTMVSKFILGNPSVAFKYLSDGKLVYQSYGDGEESAFVSVYGAGVIKDCFYIDTEKNGIKIRGYIGKHYFTKPNRTYQTVFLNGRYVVNSTVSAAVMNAYSAYLMKRQYPFYTLSITMPLGEVDVNVHPNKIDVRFSNNQIVYGAVYSAVSKVLDGTSEALNIVSETKSHNIDIKTNDTSINYTTHNASEKRDYGSYSGFDKIVFNDSGKKAETDFSVNDVKPENPATDIFAENKAYLEKLEREKHEKNLYAQNAFPFDVSAARQQEIGVERELKYIGQVLNTYLILDDGADIYFIDQHAAHERILFDKFNDSIKNNTVDTQILLVPYVFDVSNKEYDFLSDNLDVLNSMGIEIAEFGDYTFKVSAIPVIISDLNLKVFFDDLLFDLNNLKNVELTELLKEKIAQKACKAAIKSGNKLCESDTNEILTRIKGDLGLKCPHGRPIAVKITRTEIDKWFKRIV
ncbi:MAG: DNA mismatch repair endonuclease MutL [Clostridia bacterium]|nr:DNA mismatch repair endonuclease MutL [Clostridia bacterium]